MKPKMQSQKNEKAKEEELKLWISYKKTKNPRLKEKIIVQYAPLVRYVVGKIKLNIPDSVEKDDLIGWGTMGLIDAVEKFDPYKGIMFKTYAMTRIRGQIIDDLRTLDWVPRSIRQRSKEIKIITQEFKEKYQREMTHEEISQAMDISIAEVEKVVNLVNDSNVGSLEETININYNDDKVSVLDTIDAPEQYNPEYTAERIETQKIIKSEIEKLGEKEKLVLIFYYYEDLTLKEIGAIMEVTESRVCQLHRKAIQSLRSSLDLVKKSLSH